MEMACIAGERDELRCARDALLEEVSGRTTCSEVARRIARRRERETGAVTPSERARRAR